jgi:hypothetical protein
MTDKISKEARSSLMNKIKNMKITNKTLVLIIILLTTALVITLLFAMGILTKDRVVSQSQSKFSGLEKNLTEMNKEIDFYKYVDSYMTLLEDKEYDYVNEKFQTLTNSDDAQNLIMVILMNELFKDERVKNDLISLKNNISQAKKDQRNDAFQKNTACGNLVNDLQNQLKNKSKDETFLSTNTEETEKLEFIFYSPNLNTCLYATEYTYHYTDLKNYDKSWNKTAKKVYDASTNKELKDFTTYYYNYPYLNSDEAREASEKDTRNFTKYILENSNYNIDLIKN